jgi:hypothetical protein
MMPYKRTLLSICFLFIIISKSSGQDLLNYSNSLKYANYLFQNKQFDVSAIEYERVAYLNPSDTLAKLRLVQSYRFSDDFKIAKDRLVNLFPLRLSDYPEDFAIEYFAILFHERQFKDAFSYLQENKTIKLSKKTEYELGTLLMQYKWKDARTFSDNFILSNPKPEKFDDLYNVVIQGMGIRYKNPYKAALFSTLLPGSGKIYTKNWKDAIYAFLFISASSIVTYKSMANNGLNINSAFYGLITLSFYSANIYGSYKSAEKYNQKVNQLTTNAVQSVLFDE